MRLVLVAFALICTTSCRGSDAPGSGEDTQWLVLRIDTVQVAAQRPGTSIPWDDPVPQPNEGPECGILGAASSFFSNPIVGKGAEYLCNLGTRPRPREQDPSSPDLVVELSVGPTTTYPTYTARDTFNHVFRSEFIVPTGAIPPEGLLLTVSDRDGNQREVLGSLRLRQDQLRETLESNRLLTLSDPSGSLQRLEVVVSSHAGPMETAQVAMDARAGTVDSRFRPIRAGEIVEVTATGQYKVGKLYYDNWISPLGYPNGDARSFNFEMEPFKSAPHGSGLAMVGVGDARAGQSVAPCGRLVSRSSGPLILGINDSDPTNNEGRVQFKVQVRPPSAFEWLNGQTAGCANNQSP
ncbi:MAG TPA: hypothetical protein PK156_11305 [Polyangium sp.]|nr:hypothetical protein [Polyangium sp.]